MPYWIAYIIGAAAAMTALGVIWKKAIKPVARFITEADQMLPLLIALNGTFKDNPTGFKVLNEIAAQFRTDSGSSLRDAVNRLEESAKENKEAARVAAEAAEKLKVGVEAQRLLDVEDREVMRELTLQLDRVRVRLKEAAASNVRVEEHASAVAEDLAAEKRDK